MKLDANDIAADAGPDGLATQLDNLTADAIDQRTIPTECAQARDAWPKPCLNEQHALPSFPSESLPSWQREWVEAESEATQTPVDLAGMLSLAVVATACQKRVAVQVRPDWGEPTNIYVVSALDPGNRKSKVFQDATAPLCHWEHETAELQGPEVARKLAVLEIERKRLEKLKQRATGDGENAQEARRQAEDLAEMLAGVSEPVVSRLAGEDVTPEKLQSLLALHGGRFSVLSAEGGIIQNFLGRYSGNGVGNFEVLLKAHAGDTIRVDRVGRPPEYVHSPALTLGLCVQPEVLKNLARKHEVRGRGLLARLLYSLPRSFVGSRKTIPDPVPDAVAQAYSERVRDMLEIPTTCTGRGEIIPHVLALTEEAQEILNDFCATLEPRLGPGGELAEISDWASKLAGAIVRIAGLLHMAERSTKTFVPPEIGAQSFAAALAIGGYLTKHAQATFQFMETDTAAIFSDKVIAWLKRNRKPLVHEREIYQKINGMRKKDVRKAVIRDLCDRDILIPVHVETGKTGRKRSQAYAVNPFLYDEYPT